MPLRAAIRTLNVTNVSSSSRGLALAALCFMRVGSLIIRFPRRFFRADALRLSLSSRCLPIFLLLLFRRCGFSTLIIPQSFPCRYFFLLACDLGISTLLASGPTFFAAAVSRRFTRLPQETISHCWDASPLVDAVSRLVPSESMSSHINRRQVGASSDARILQRASRGTVGARYRPSNTPYIGIHVAHVFVYLCITLHITTRSGHVLLVLLCYTSLQWRINECCMYVCRMYILDSTFCGIDQTDRYGYQPMPVVSWT